MNLPPSQVSYFPHEVSDSGIVLVLVVNLFVFALGLLWFLACKNRYPYYYRPQAGRKKSKLYSPPSHITEASLAPIEDVDVDEEPSLDKPEPNPPAEPTAPVPSATDVDGILNWIITLVKWDDQKIFRTYGVDVFVYLHFLKFCIILFSFFSLIGLAILLPTNYSGNWNNTGFNATLLGNLKESDNRFWIHLAAVYVFTAFTVYFVWNTYQSHIHYMHDYRKLPLPSNYSCVVTNIPSSVKAPEKLKEHFDNFFPNQVIAAHMLYDTTNLERKILDREVVKYSLESAQQELAKTGLRPKHTTGYLRLGEERDSISHYTERLETLRKEIKDEQDAYLSGTLTKKTPGIGFITFDSLTNANMCAQTALSKTRWSASFAPALSDIHWDLLRIGKVQSWSRRLIVSGIVTVLIVFWSIPVSLLAQLSNLHTLGKFDWARPFVVWVYSLPSWMVSTITRFLPTIVLFLLMLLLVPVLRLLVAQERRPQKSHQEMSTFKKYYAFLLLNVLFLSTLFSQLGGIITAAAENPGEALIDVARLLGRTLPSFGGFFINYIFNAGFAAGALSLCRIIWFFIHLIQLKLAKTSQHRAQIKKDACWSLEYDVQYALHLTIVTVALSYSSMVPLILPATVGYFLIWYVVDKWSLMFVHYEYFDAQGRWGSLVYRRIFIALIIYHFTMFGIFLVKVAFWPSVLVLPLFAFDFYVISATNHYTRKAKYLPLEEAHHHRLTATALGFDKAFTSPALSGQGLALDSDDLSDVPSSPMTSNPRRSHNGSPRSPSVRTRKVSGGDSGRPKRRKVSQGEDLNLDVEQPPMQLVDSPRSLVLPEDPLSEGDASEGILVESGGIVRPDEPTDSSLVSLDDM